jgi:hypothetical protein
VFQYEAPTADRRVKVIRDTTTEVKREGVLDELAHQWFPASPEAVQHAHTALKNGNRPELIQAVKSDPALFLYCAKQLNHVMERSQEGYLPLAALEHASEEELWKIIPVSVREVSAHSLTKASELQALRMQHALLSTNAAEKIAPQIALPAESGFSVASFRQMGLHLVAWNYPAVYSRALVQQRRSGSLLDEEIESLLGLSPSEIGSRLAIKWGLHADLRQALISADEDEPTVIEGTPLHQLPTIQRLQNLCEATESFAAAKDPKYFPQGPKRWKQAGGALKEYCTDEVFSEIEENTKRLLQERAHSCPVLDRLPFSRRVELTIVEQSLAEQNAYLRRCSTEVQLGFSNVYNLIVPGELSLEAIEVLIDAIPPQLGFQHGCLFLLDTKSMKLVPSLRIGAHRLERYARFFQENRSAIIDSLDSLVPLKQLGIGIDGVPAVAVVGPLRSALHPGVLYTELLRTFSDDALHPTIIHFQAFRVALEHALGDTGNQRL